MKLKNWHKLKPWQKGKRIGLALAIIWIVGGIVESLGCNHAIGLNPVCNIPAFLIFGAPFTIFQIISLIPYVLFDGLFNSIPSNIYLDTLFTLLSAIILPSLLTILFFTIAGFIIGKLIAKIKSLMGKK